MHALTHTHSLAYNTRHNALLTLSRYLRASIDDVGRPRVGGGGASQRGGGGDGGVERGARHLPRRAWTGELRAAAGQ